MDDLQLYERVIAELRREGPHPGLWAKAFAETGGNKNQAEALYLRYRVAQLAKAERAMRAAERKDKEDALRAAAEAEEAQRRERARAEGLTPIHWLLIGLGVFFIGLLLLRAIGLL